MLMKPVHLWYTTSNIGLPKHECGSPENGTGINVAGNRAAVFAQSMQLLSSAAEVCGMWHPADDRTKSARRISRGRDIQ